MKDLLDILKNTFHHDSFREYQEEIVECLIKGKDILAILPTGYGKSICYQLPALIVNGITIVVSPLIALMKDQVKKLKELGIAAAYLNSDLNQKQLETAYNNAKRGQYKIIYVSPERLETREFVELAYKSNISLFIIDEAHCVLEWGKSFRPSYLNISKFIEKLPKRPTIGAFTATLPKNSEKVLIEKLNLISPSIISVYNVKKNICINVKYIEREYRRFYVANYIEANKTKKGIIYCLTRKDVNNLCDFLNNQGVKCAIYHAGLEVIEKRMNLEKFYSDYNIMVATKAFGMGIDIPNIDYVINYGMPESIENYLQQIGRAGRNGNIANAILMYDKNDYRINVYLIIKSIMRKSISADDKVKLISEGKEKLDCMLAYCKTTICRQKFLKIYFGNDTKFTCCNKCDNCRRRDTHD